MLSFLLKTRNKNTAQKILQSHALLQTYGAILPTSLTYVPSLIDQRFLTLETCCGYWYGRLWKAYFTPFGFQGLIATLAKIIHVRVTKWPFFISNRKKHTNVFFFAFSNWFISGVFTTHKMRVSNKLERKDNFSQSYD